MKIGILAGEASGDLLGAKLIHALREIDPELQVEGIGGAAMAAAGCRNLFDIERLSVMGFIEPLKRLPDLLKLRRDIYKHFIEHKPDVFIGIDAPDFNLGLELKLRTAGIPVVHYVSPSVWAWRQYRVHKIAKAVDLMLTLLPFEKAFYEQFHVPAHYVGHPLADQIPLEIDKLAARKKLGLDEHATYVALLPGSRRQELKFMSESYLLAAKKAFQSRPPLRFITSHVNEDRYQAFQQSQQQLAPEIPLQFFLRESHNVMAAADVVIVTSGTATLEAMLFKKPMIIAYRMSWFTRQLARLLVNVRFAGLPNILANEMVVPELIQEAAHPDAILQHLLDYLDHPEKVAAVVARFTQLHQELRADSSRQASRAIVALLK